MKVVEAYAPTSSHDDEEVNQFYENVALAVRKVQTMYTVVMGDFNAKVGKKQAGEQAIGNYGIGSRNTRGEMFVKFEERNRLLIMNTFFSKRSNRKWTWKSPNGETTNEIDFILSVDPSLVHDEVLGRVKCSDHRLVRSRISLNLKRERVKYIKKKQANLDAVRVKGDQFRLVLANKHAALEQEDEDNIDVMNEIVTRLISEAAVEVGGKAPRQPVGKISQVTKNLIKKRQNIKVSNSRGQIEFAELSELINKKKVRNIRNYNGEKIEEAVKYGRSMKSVRRKLGIGKCKMYALKDKQGNTISNFNDIVKTAQELYTDLYSTQTQGSQAASIRSSDDLDTGAPSITSDEVIRALQDMTRGKSAAEDEMQSI